MIKIFTEEKIIAKDLIIKKTEGAKTIEDHSNKDYIEQGYIQEEQAKVLDNICKKLFNMDVSTLILDIGFNDEKDIEVFYKEFGDILAGSVPRGQ